MARARPRDSPPWSPAQERRAEREVHTKDGGPGEGRSRVLPRRLRQREDVRDRRRARGRRRGARQHRRPRGARLGAGAARGDVDDHRRATARPARRQPVESLDVRLTAQELRAPRRCPRSRDVRVPAEHAADVSGHPQWRDHGERRPGRTIGFRPGARREALLTHFVVFMNARDPKPSQELHSRAVLTLSGDRATGEAYTMAHHLTVAGAKRSLLRGAEPLRRPDRWSGRCRDGEAGGRGRRHRKWLGGYALRYALEDPAVGAVTSIGRRKLGIAHPRLNEVVHPEASPTAPALAATLAGHDAAVFCLGTYTGVVSDEELRIITVGYTVEFARVLHACSPEATFSFLSGNGADPTGQSRLPYARYKRGRGGDVAARWWVISPHVYVFSGPRTSTPWSLARNPTSATASCDGSTRRFGSCSPTWLCGPTTWLASWCGCGRARNTTARRSSVRRTGTSGPCSRVASRT